MERLILVLYDLSSSKALRQIPKILARFNSRRIQKSVYKALVNEKEEIKLQDLIVKPKTTAKVEPYSTSYFSS